MKTRFLSPFYMFLVLLSYCQLNYADFLYRADNVLKDEFNAAEARSLNQNGTVGGKFIQDGENFEFIVSKEFRKYRSVDIHPTSFPIVNNKNEMMNLTFKYKLSVFGIRKAYVNQYVYNPKNNIFEIQGEDIDLGAVPDTTGYRLIFGTYVPPYHLRGFNDKGESLYTSHEDPLKVNASIVYLKDAPYIIEGKFIGAINNNSEALVTVEKEGFGDFLSQNCLKIVDAKNKEIAVVANEALFGVGMNDRRDVIATSRDGTQGFFWNETGGLLSLDSFIPVAINNNGDIVGKMHINLGFEHPCWLRKSDGTLVDLYEVVDFGELSVTEITSVTAINDKGQILINVLDKGKMKPLLLNPIEK